MTPERHETAEFPVLPSIDGHLALDSRPAPLPRPVEVRGREILGVSIAMTDYQRAMDVMDGLIARGEHGYVCAVAVHAVMVAQRDPEMAAALAGSALTVPDGMPLVWAANLLGEETLDPELLDRVVRVHDAHRA